MCTPCKTTKAKAGWLCVAGLRAIVHVWSRSFIVIPPLEVVFLIYLAHLQHVYKGHATVAVLCWVLRLIYEGVELLYSKTLWILFCRMNAQANTLFPFILHPEQPKTPSFQRTENQIQTTNQNRSALCLIAFLERSNKTVSIVYCFCHCAFCDVEKEIISSKRYFTFLGLSET